MTTPLPIDQQARHERHAAWLFALAFVGACGLFWWLPSLIYRGVLNTLDPVADPVLVFSLITAAFFLIGFFFIAPRKPALPVVHGWELGGCADWGYALSLILALPVFVLAVDFTLQRSQLEYGFGEGLPLLYQALFYAHIFFSLLFLGASRWDSSNRKRILLVMVLLLLPRLMISLFWGRLFIAQALVPVVLLAMARGWLQLSFAQLLKLVLLAALIIFVPSITRGDQFFGGEEIVQYFSAGSTLQLFQNNLDFDLTDHCQPLLVSLTAKLIPWGALHECTTDLHGQLNIPATINRLITHDQFGQLEAIVGTGSNFMLELFLFGGLGTVLLGALLLGVAARWFIHWLTVPSIFAGIWAECLMRTLWAPRDNFGYVFERVPSLILVTLCIAALAYLTHRQAPPFWQRKPA